MGVRRYRDLECWQLASELKMRVYASMAVDAVRRDLRFYDQIRDAARGGPRAIAEGFGRVRPAEFARFLEYARASLIETQNHLDDARDCHYIDNATHDELIALADRAIGAVTSLRRYLKQKGNPG